MQLALYDKLPGRTWVDDGLIDEHGDAAELLLAPLVHDIERGGAGWEKIEDEVRALKAGGKAAAQTDPITNKNMGRRRWKWRRWFACTKEYEAKKVRFHGPVRAFLNQALGLAAMGLQEATKDKTENEDVKKLDEAQIPEAMEIGVFWDWEETGRDTELQVTRVVEERFMTC